MDAANRLEVGGIIFLITICVIVLIAFILWLKSKSDTAKLANKRLEIEQEGKRDRAKLYADATKAQADAISKLNDQVAGMRQDASAHSTSLGKMLNEHNARLAHQIQVHEETNSKRETARDQRFGEVFAQLKIVMDELLDRQKGVINLDDTLRIIDECFQRSVKPAAVATAEQSLRANHWSTDRVFIEERVKQELNNTLYNCERGISNYQLSIDHKLFFPGQADGPFDLAVIFWNIIKELHEAGAAEQSSLDQRIRLARIRIENAANLMFNEAKQAALRIYHGKVSPETATLRFTTPRPNDSME